MHNPFRDALRVLSCHLDLRREPDTRPRGARVGRRGAAAACWGCPRRALCPCSRSYTGSLAPVPLGRIGGARPPDSPPITIIDFDRVGLDENDSSHWLTITWRSRTSKWGAWFGNWRYDVSGNRSWEGDWPFDDDVTIPVGAAVESRFDANWYIAEATYSFVQNETIDTGIGFGFHIVDLKTELRAKVSVGNAEIEVAQGDLDTLAPLPNILGYLHWNIHPRWEAIARLGWFGLSYDIYDGQMTNAHALINFSVTDRITLGGGYQFVSLDLDIERKRYREIYDIDFDGPMVFARIWF